MAIDTEKAKKDLHFARYPRELEAVIDHNIAGGQTKFELQHVVVPANSNLVKLEYKAELNADGERLYYNGMNVTAEYNDGRKETTWFSSKHKLTLLDAQILLSDPLVPRSVQKTYFNSEGKKEEAWVQVDFNKHAENGKISVYKHSHFDLVTTLKDFDTKERSVDDSFKTQIKRLELGLGQEFTPVNSREYHKLIFYANASYNTVHITDAGGKLLEHDQFRTPEARERKAAEKAEWVNRQKSAGAVNDASARQSADPVGDEKKNSNRSREVKEHTERKNGMR